MADLGFKNVNGFLRNKVKRYALGAFGHIVFLSINIALALNR